MRPELRRDQCAGDDNRWGRGTGTGTGHDTNHGGLGRVATSIPRALSPGTGIGACATGRR
jgi:hypothetical protein